MFWIGENSVEYAEADVVDLVGDRWDAVSGYDIFFGYADDFEDAVLEVRHFILGDVGAGGEDGRTVDEVAEAVGSVCRHEHIGLPSNDFESLEEVRECADSGVDTRPLNVRAELGV